MTSPKIILEILSKNNSKVDNIYKHLYNPEFYKIAYNNIYSKPSQMTPASDGSTIDGMSEERINRLIQSLRDKTYQPTPLRRVNIPKKSGGTRPISVPSFNDKLVQEVIRMLLEAIYDHTFSEHSHGYRVKKSCHTAIDYVRKHFRGTKWWIECDIRGCFDQIDHQVLINILSNRIKERVFLELIRKFLKVGYIENWKYNKTYSGCPQGSIISPILSNIYLNEFDRFMEKKKVNFDIGKSRRRDKDYMDLHRRLYVLKKNKTNDKNIADEIREINKKLRKFTSTQDEFDETFKRLKYVRYADDFIIGVIGSRKEAEGIKLAIEEFLKRTLKLKLNTDKTKIIHNTKKINFVGYELSVLKSNEKKSINGQICFWLPYDVCKNYILNNRFGKFVCDVQTGKPKLKAIHRPELINLDELEILMQYNVKIRGLYNYYKMASNISKLYSFGHIIETSFVKTLSYKYKTSCSKLYKNKNYSKNHKFGITHKDKFYEFFNGPFKVVKSITYEKNVDNIENILKYSGRTSLIQRLEAKKCEFCGSKDGPFEVHHIKKLKDLKGKAAWEKLMIARRRKTMVLCVTCHDKLHAGKL